MAIELRAKTAQEALLLERLILAIVDSYKLKPRQWLVKHGNVLATKSSISKDYQHLADDYKDTVKEMKTKLRKTSPKSMLLSGSEKAC